jgi:gamma-glutamylcyclotransferase (GGCT)/AIG2-like uncharacterized protein YtfP
MQPKEYLVFVYGTLLLGEANHRVAKPHLLNVEKGTVKGFLHNIGPYPALVLHENGMEIVGEWFTVTEEGLAQMDVLEDFEVGSENNLYERVIVNDLYKQLNGYVYVFDKDKAKDLPLIKSGSWRNRTY